MRSIIKVSTEAYLLAEPQQIIMLVKFTEKNNQVKRVTRSQRLIKDSFFVAFFLIRATFPIFPEFHKHHKLSLKRAAESIGPGFKSISSATGRQQPR